MDSENPFGKRLQHHPPLRISRLRPFSPLLPPRCHQPRRQTDRAPSQSPRLRRRRQRPRGVHRRWGFPRGVSLHARGPHRPPDGVDRPRPEGYSERARRRQEVRFAARGAHFLDFRHGA